MFTTKSFTTFWLRTVQTKGWGGQEESNLFLTKKFTTKNVCHRNLGDLSSTNPKRERVWQAAGHLVWWTGNWVIGQRVLQLLLIYSLHLIKLTLRNQKFFNLDLFLHLNNIYISWGFDKNSFDFCITLDLQLISKVFLNWNFFQLVPFDELVFRVRVATSDHSFFNAKGVFLQILQSESIFCACFHNFKGHAYFKFL